MDRSVKTILTNMCMISDGSRVLVQNKDGKGIIFPGGHIENDESVTDSVIREIYEETGLTISKPQLCGVKDRIYEDGTRYVVFLFKADKFSGELSSSDEGEVFWADIEKLTELDLMWHMDIMLKIFLKGEYSELFLDRQRDWKAILK